jgi:hypothetical protein
MEQRKPAKEKVEDCGTAFKKSPEYKRFKGLLRKVVKAPPLKHARRTVQGDVSGPK